MPIDDSGIKEKTFPSLDVQYTLEEGYKSRAESGSAGCNLLNEQSLERK